MPAPGVVYSQFTARKGRSAKYSAVLVQEDGVTPLPVASLSTLTLTLVDDATGTVINGRSSQNALNANNVTIDASGNLVWTMTPADNPIVGSGLAHGRCELHLATFEWTWSAGAKKGYHNVWVSVEQNRNAS